MRGGPTLVFIHASDVDGGDTADCAFDPIPISE
jgi:hypothetical protein